MTVAGRSVARVGRLLESQLPMEVRFIETSPVEVRLLATSPDRRLAHARDDHPVHRVFDPVGPDSRYPVRPGGRILPPP
ncbi:hypothetical protein EA472_14185 [Natrarchaeobius oligotrophus]|uniref:Uncharacterized protein n=1 Tax=Natrarchaeobius chitinivorans TaxID=1679083 RepID=A0A3N6NJR1_NATCH|nr:hypothetical protein EA472_14185 [Natrarchaeobius chitinivorans]